MTQDLAPFLRIFGYDALGRFTGTTTLSDAAYPWSCGGSGRFDPNYGYVGCAIDSVATPNVYSYNDAENRIGSGITLGVGDQMSSSDGFNYTYDADGNLASRVYTAYGAEFDYRWSSDNRLLQSASNSPLGTTTIEYDALGQPVIRRGGDGRVNQVTLFDGGSVMADLDSLGYRRAEYVYDAGTDRPYAMLKEATTVTSAEYFVQDDLGNVEGTLYDSTHVAQTVAYGDFGLPTISGDSTNRLLWKGLPFDGNTGLVYVRSRWYDPVSGRFVSEDPLGLGGGINPYVFANNDPVNGFDPSGQTVQISFDNDNCQYTRYIGQPDLYFELGGCDFGAGGSMTDFNPFAADAPWSHLDEPEQGDARTGGGRPTPGQVFAAVGRELTPFNNAMNCVQSAAALGVTGALDWTGGTEIYRGVKGAEAIVTTIDAISFATTRSAVTVASIETSTIRVAADATAVRSINVGMAKSAALG